MRLSPKLRIVIIVMLFGAAGCSRLLPSGKLISTSPWQDYKEAKTAFDKIEVGTTTVDDLSRLGFDVKTYPNLKVLNYLDVATMVQTIPIDQLDPGLQACLRARADCRAYVFE